jgi:hypothetical protein
VNSDLVTGHVSNGASFAILSKYMKNGLSLPGLVLLISLLVPIFGHAADDDSSIHWVPDRHVTTRDFSRLDVRVVPRQPEGIDLREWVPDKNRVVIGIESRKHVYLVVGNVRFDGRILHDPQATVYENELPVGRGAFVVLENLPLTTVRALREAVLSAPNQAYFGCVHAALSKLADAGIQISPPDELVVYTSRLLEIIQNNGFSLNNGQKIQTKFFSTSDIDMTRWPSQLAQHDQEVSDSIRKNYKGMSPDAMMEKIAGRVRPISPELRPLMAKLTRSHDRLTWSRAPIAPATLPRTCSQILGGVGPRSLDATKMSSS